MSDDKRQVLNHELFLRQTYQVYLNGFNVFDPDHAPMDYEMWCDMESPGAFIGHLQSQLAAAKEREAALVRFTMNCETNARHYREGGDICSAVMLELVVENLRKDFAPLFTKRAAQVEGGE